MFQSAYQDGDSVEVFSPAGKDPAAAWNLGGKVRRVYDKGVKGYVLAISGGATSKMQLPKAPKGTLGLRQRHLVVQILTAASHDKPFSMELGVTDSGGARRRLVLSSSFRTLHCTPLHAQIPLPGLERQRGVWANLSVDLVGLTSMCFRADAFGALDLLVIGPTCRIRKIFTMRGALDSADGCIDGIAELELSTMGGIDGASVEPLPLRMAFPSGVTPSPRNWVISPATLTAFTNRLDSHSPQHRTTNTPSRATNIFRSTPRPRRSPALRQPNTSPVAGEGRVGQPHASLTGTGKPSPHSPGQQQSAATPIKAAPNASASGRRTPRSASSGRVATPSPHAAPSPRTTPSRSANHSRPSTASSVAHSTPGRRDIVAERSTENSSRDLATDTPPYMSPSPSRAVSGAGGGTPGRLISEGNGVVSHASVEKQGLPARRRVSTSRAAAAAAAVARRAPNGADFVGIATGGTRICRRSAVETEAADGARELRSEGSEGGGCGNIFAGGRLEAETTKEKCTVRVNWVEEEEGLSRGLFGGRRSMDDEPASVWSFGKDHMDYDDRDGVGASAPTHLFSTKPESPTFELQSGAIPTTTTVAMTATKYSTSPSLPRTSGPNYLHQTPTTASKTTREVRSVGGGTSAHATGGHTSTSGDAIVPSPDMSRNEDNRHYERWRSAPSHRKSRGDEPRASERTTTPTSLACSPQSAIPDPNDGDGGDGGVTAVQKRGAGSGPVTADAASPTDAINLSSAGSCSQHESEPVSVEQAAATRVVNSPNSDRDVTLGSRPLYSGTINNRGEKCSPSTRLDVLQSLFASTSVSGSGDDSQAGPRNGGGSALIDAERDRDQQVAKLREALADATSGADDRENDDADVFESLALENNAAPATSMVGGGYGGDDGRAHEYTTPVRMNYRQGVYGDGATCGRADGGGGDGDFRVAANSVKPAFLPSRSVKRQVPTTTTHDRGESIGKQRVERVEGSEADGINVFLEDTAEPISFASDWGEVDKEGLRCSDEYLRDRAEERWDDDAERAGRRQPDSDQNQNEIDELERKELALVDLEDSYHLEFGSVALSQSSEEAVVTLFEDDPGQAIDLKAVSDPSHRSPASGNREQPPQPHGPHANLEPPRETNVTNADANDDDVDCVTFGSAGARESTREYLRPTTEEGFSVDERNQADGREVSHEAAAGVVLAPRLDAQATPSSANKKTSVKHRRGTSGSRATTTVPSSRVNNEAEDNTRGGPLAGCARATNLGDISSGTVVSGRRNDHDGDISDRAGAAGTGEKRLERGGKPEGMLGTEAVGGQWKESQHSMVELMNEDEPELFFDPVLNCYYDKAADKYYGLT